MPSYVMTSDELSCLSTAVSRRIADGHMEPHAGWALLARIKVASDADLHLLHLGFEDLAGARAAVAGVAGLEGRLA